MKVVVTGAAGFLGSRLADALLAPDSPFYPELPISSLLLVDTLAPAPRADPRVRTLALDLTAPDAAECVISHDTQVLFHLAAVVSGHAEADFDLGLRVNFDATRALLEVARRQVPSLRFIFVSTAGVFGGDLPPVVNDFTAATPQNSYGTAKAMSELLVNDYSRRGYVDGRVVRLPTVTVRPGLANQAVTSFASGIIREPLNGLPARCPVDLAQELWITSPRKVVHNILHAATLAAEALGPWRCVALPGLRTSVQEMVAALRTVGGEETAALVYFERDALISRMVASFPIEFDNTRALRLGFTVDKNFEDIVRQYVNDELKRN